MPATHTTTDDPPSTISDDLTKDFDPIIGNGQPEGICRRYYNLLREAVLSEYSSKQKPFTPIQTIYQRVEMITDEIQGAN